VIFNLASLPQGAKSDTWKKQQTGYAGIFEFWYQGYWFWNAPNSVRTEFPFLVFVGQRTISVVRCLVTCSSGFIRYGSPLLKRGGRIHETPFSGHVFWHGDFGLRWWQWHPNNLSTRWNATSVFWKASWVAFVRTCRGQIWAVGSVRNSVSFL